MGSGPSVRQKTVSIDEAGDKTSVKSLSLPSPPQSASSSTQDDYHHESFRKGERKIGKYEKLYKDIEKQMGDLEVTNLDLQDKVENLEQQLEYQRNTTSMLSTVMEVDETEVEQCSGTVKAKDLMICKLQTEIEMMQLETKKLRIRCKKKIRTANAKLTEIQQGSSLKTFELNNEMVCLREENEELTAQIQEYDGNPRSKTAASRNSQSEEADPRTSLILDLSSQVSQQDARITQLENRLHEKDKIIEQMKRDHQQLVTGQTQQQEDAVSPELSELQQIAAEMKALKGSKKMKSRKKGFGQHMPSPPELDFRGSSGRSRDSGIVNGELVLAESPETGDAHSGHKDDIKTSLSDDDDKWGAGTGEKNGDNNDTQLNIRRISAMKKRRRHKAIDEMVSPIPSNADCLEVDSLIQSIDHTLSIPPLSEIST